MLPFDDVIMELYVGGEFTGSSVQPSCNVTNFDNTDKPFTNWTLLALNDNLINHLDQRSFPGMFNLLVLNLKNNLINVLVNGIFEDLQNLEYLNLAGNEIALIEAMTFSNLYNLNDLDVSENKLKTISEKALGYSTPLFRSLNFVDFSSNKLTDFPLWLLNVPALFKANLSENFISFKGMNSVLSKLSTYAIQPFRSLKPRELIFYQNRFTSFDISQLRENEQSVLIKFLSFATLDFGGNVFYCDCKMYQLYTLFRASGISDTDKPGSSIGDSYIPASVFYENINNFKCLHPVGVRGLPLVHVPITTFACHEDVIGCPFPCRCWVRSYDGAVKVECINNNLTHLVSAIPSHAITLNFSTNLLPDMPSPLPRYLLSLEILDLSHNQLQYLNEDLIGMIPNVTQLYWSNNQLTSLPHIVSTKPQVTQMTFCYMITSWNGSTSRTTGPLWGKPPVIDGFPAQMASHAKLCCQPVQTAAQTVNRQVN